MELQGEGWAGEWLYLQGFVEHAGGILEPSRRLQGTQTIVVHEVLLGLGSAGGLWPKGEEMWGNAWFGVVGWGCGFGLSGGTALPCAPPILHLHLPTLTPAQSQGQNEYSSVARNI